MKHRRMTKENLKGLIELRDENLKKIAALQNLLPQLEDKIEILECKRLIKINKEFVYSPVSGLNDLITKGEKDVEKTQAKKKILKLIKANI